MNLRELLLITLVGWTAIGAIGITISLVQKERKKALRHAGWIAGVWVAYLAVLVVVSLLQPQKIVAVGQDQCFDEMCFAVISVEEVPGFLIHDGSRLVRVSLRITNHARGHTQSEKLIRAYLMDAQGRRWQESAAISGVPLTARIVAGDSVVSAPVFKVANDATGLGLVFNHGWWQPGVLVIGNSDSLLHRRTIVPLGR
jgi:hypothetical protein